MSDTAIKPLHVRVAEALGWSRCREFEQTQARIWVGAQPWKDYPHEDDWSEAWIPHFDTDWSATGPLIEKYEFNLQPYAPAPWVACSYNGDDEAFGETPLIAVCNLIIALHEAGKLSA